MDDAKREGFQAFKGLKYSVFALGSSLYDNFCAFGKFCDDTIEVLGGQRVAPLVLGDEEKGQEGQFQIWTKMSMNGLSDVFEMEIPQMIKENWPFSNKIGKKISWLSTKFKSANVISGNCI